MASMTLTVILALLVAVAAGQPIQTPPDETATCALLAKQTARSNGTVVFALPIMSPITAYNPFWLQVINGAMTAGRRLGVNVEFRGLDVPDTSCDSLKGYPGLLREAANTTDILGMVVIAYQPPPGCNVDVLGAIEEVSAKLPVIAINSNPTGAIDAGALAYVGQNETAAGREACTALAEKVDSEANVLVLGLDNGQNPGIIARFDGCSQVAKAQYIEANLGTETDTAAIVAALKNDTSINAILSLGGNEVNAMLTALKETGRSGVPLGSFDWTAGNTTDALGNGTLAFVVDQQSQLQGALPVELLYNSTIGGANAPPTEFWTGPILADSPTAACLAFSTPPCGLCTANAGSELGSLVSVDSATKSWTLKQAGDATDGVSALATAMKQPDECAACVDCSTGPTPAPGPVSPPAKPSTPSPTPSPSGEGGASSTGMRALMSVSAAACLWIAAVV